MRSFLIVVLLFSFHCARSQDTIFLYSDLVNSYKDTILNAKVLEISSSAIKYTAADNPSGPVYVLKRSTVKKIIYANGKQELFDIRADIDSKYMNENMARHAVFAELRGNGVADLSFNYDYTFYRTAEWGIAARAGINTGWSGNNSTAYMVVPLMVSFIYGKEAALEVGAGAALADYIEYNYCSYCWPNNDGVKVTRFIATGIFGFRYQRKNAFFFKLAVTPFIMPESNSYSDNLFNRFDVKDKGLFLTLGLSMGFAF